MKQSQNNQLRLAASRIGGANKRKGGKNAGLKALNLPSTTPGQPACERGPPIRDAAYGWLRRARGRPHLIFGFIVHQQKHRS